MRKNYIRNVFYGILAAPFLVSCSQNLASMCEEGKFGKEGQLLRTDFMGRKINDTTNTQYRGYFCVDIEGNAFYASVIDLEDPKFDRTITELKGEKANDLLDKVTQRFIGGVEPVNPENIDSVINVK